MPVRPSTMVSRLVALSSIIVITSFSLLSSTNANDAPPTPLPEDQPDYAKNSIPVPSTVQLATETLTELLQTQTSQNKKLETKAEKNKEKKADEEESDKTSTVGDSEKKEAAPLGPGGQEQQQQAFKESYPDSEEDKNLDFDGTELIKWINNNGGYIHQNVRIGLDPTGNYRGVFVKEWGEGESGVEGEIGGPGGGIGDGDVICKIPWKLLIKPKDYEYKQYWSCNAVQELYDQFLLGEKSPFAPYVKYLMNQPRGRIPSEWTANGKKLLRFVLGQKRFKGGHMQEGLPPNNFQKRYEDVWLDDCEGEDTPLARAAYYQFTSRDEDTLMVPFYDMCNHSNDPKKLNTISAKPRRKGKPFILRATRDIAPGEQIFISYNRCNRCWFDPDYTDCTSWSHYGTSEIFDVFGFVEDFPQTWSLPMILEDDDDEDEDWDRLTFCLDREDDGTLWVTFGDNYSEDYEDEVPNEEEYEFLSRTLARLHDIGNTIKTNETIKEEMPSYEWEMIWRYEEALMTAISAAILASDAEGTIYENWDGGDSEDSSDDEDGEVEVEYDDEDEDEGFNIDKDGVDHVQERHDRTMMDEL
mmetsp:Transcript_28118/g.59009  ORF Transcript_28118/g.59009 Transcript_28118/m.59009 type:complete len:584 (+) Transcript_28118:154-1905(+)